MRLNWRCRRCGAIGHDAPGLASFWAHWWGWHGPYQAQPAYLTPMTSIYRGTR